MTESSLVPRHRPLESCMAGPGNEASRKYKVQNFADSACTGFIFTAIPVNLAGYTGIWQVRWHHAEMLCRVSSVINLLWWCLLYYTLPVVMWFCNDNLCREFHIATTPAWLLYGFMHLSSWILLYRYSHAFTCAWHGRHSLFPRDLENEPLWKTCEPQRPCM